MPVVGVECDDPKHKGEVYTFEECLQCKLNRGPRSCNTSYQVIKAMSLNKKEREDAGMSTTMITDKCMRAVILKEEEDYVEKPSATVPRIRGTIYHLFYEKYSDGLEPYIAEKRFKRTVTVLGEEIVITGKPDLILLDLKRIIDAKSIGDTYAESKSVSRGIALDSHEAQVNIYRWIAADGIALEDGEHVQIDIEFGHIQYIDMMRELEVEVRIWPLEETEAYIIKKLTPVIKYYQTGELPPILTTMWGERDLICNYCPVRNHCDRRANA